MISPSILFPDGFEDHPSRLTQPEFFVDLALDQIVTTVTAGKEDYDLKPFFYLPLTDADSIIFRHAVLRDLEDPQRFADCKKFAASLRQVREYLAQGEKLHYPRQQERCFLAAVDDYCAAVTCLSQNLSTMPPTSPGLTALREWLEHFVISAEFVQLQNETHNLVTGLAAIRYCVQINGLLIQVRDYTGEANYSDEIETVFERFKSGAHQGYRFESKDFSSMNHVETRILDLVAECHPQLFADLTRFCQIKMEFFSPAITNCDREIQFYLTYLEFIAPLEKSGLQFCYPHFTESDKEIHNHSGFDLALAAKLIQENSLPVCNDFQLQGKERIIVVSGPNQGGKTTFARTFGQLHYLGSLGLRVPGKDARLYLYDHLFTHFEREEQLTNLQGKLKDDLVRIHAILEDATPRSIILINEIFASTTFLDASLLSRAVMEKLIQLDLLAIWVTFIDELASFDESTLSMVSTVVPENPAVRTFQIVRSPADGLAYAFSIAEKYRLTSTRIRERLNQ